MDGSENECLEKHGAPAFLESLYGHGGDQSAEDVFLKNGGHEGQNE